MYRLLISAFFCVSVLGLTTNGAEARSAKECGAEAQKMLDSALPVSSRGQEEKVKMRLEEAVDAANAGKKRKCEKKIKGAKRILE